MRASISTFFLREADFSTERSRRTHTHEAATSSALRLSPSNVHSFWCGAGAPVAHGGYSTVSGQTRDQLGVEEALELRHARGARALPL